MLDSLGFRLQQGFRCWALALVVKSRMGTSDRKVTKSQQPRLALSADSHKMLRGLESLGFRPKHVPWFLSSPFIIRVPFFPTIRF